MSGETAPWTWVGTLSAFDGRTVVGVECQGHRLALYRLADGIFASSDTCPHQGATLSQGCVIDGFVECPVHYALFDIRTGISDGALTTRPLRTVATRVEQDDIYVDLSGFEETHDEG